jgi:hypothetical protein
MSGKAATTGGKGKGKGGRGEKKQQTSSSSKAGLQFPVGRIARYLRNGKVRAWCEGREGSAWLVLGGRIV